VCSGEGGVFGGAKEIRHGGVKSFGRSGVEDFVLEVFLLGCGDHVGDFVSGVLEDLSVNCKIC
jgi:hypothetical protein